MPATFGRVHNWATDEVIRTSDLNAEFNNILNNLDPSGVGDWSTTVAQMRLTTSPGGVGTESLATALSGEIQRLRYMIQAILGVAATQWYSSPTTDLTQIKAALGSTLNTNRIVSGQSSTFSSTSRFFLAGSSTPAVTALGATAPLVYAILGTNYTIATNLPVGPLNLAPVATAIVNDASLTGQESSQWVGEDNTTIAITNASAAITNLVGSYAAFSVKDSGNTEYFMGFVASSTTLTNCLRGFFFNGSLAPIPRIPINNNDTISLCKLTWLYGTTASSVVIGYTPPTFAYAQPASPNVGDYWYDMNTQVWLTFNSTTWVTASAVLLGACVQDTANTVGARSFDYFQTSILYSNMVLNYNGTASIIGQNYGGKVGVGTNLINFQNTKPIWSSSTLDPDASVAFSASRTYWSYIGEQGQLYLSWTKPYNSISNGQGWYHPYENWRAIGYMLTNSATAFVASTLTSYPLDINTTAAVSGSSDYNYLVNSAFDYWQRSTSLPVLNQNSTVIANNAAYIADQWYVNNVLGGNTSSIAAINGIQQAGVNPGSIYGMQVLIETAPTVGTGAFVPQNGCELYQVLSLQSSQQLVNSTVSFSALIQGQGNVNQVGISLWYNTSVAKVFGNSAGTVASTQIGTEIVHTVNNSAFVVCSLLNQNVGTAFATNGVLGVRIRISGVSSGNPYAVGNGFIVEQTQLNRGPSVSQWARQFKDPEVEFSTCQYYYEKSFPVTTFNTVVNSLNGMALLPTYESTAAATWFIPYKVRKRVSTGSVLVFDLGSTPAQVGALTNNTTPALVASYGVGVSGGQFFPYTADTGFYFRFVPGAAGATISAICFNWQVDASI